MVGIKPNRYGCNLPNSNEDWQFQNPILKVSADTPPKRGEEPKIIKARPIETNTIPASEYLASLTKEDKPVRFTDLPLEERIKQVAELYNDNTLSTSDITKRLGIGLNYLYDHVKTAREQGLITALRSEQSPAKVVADVTRFAEIAEERKQAADRAVQAQQIAQAIHELLGEESGEVLGVFLNKVIA